MCTGIHLSSIEGKHYLGRTQEYNINFDYIGVQIPKNFVRAAYLLKFSDPVRSKDII